MTLLEQSVTLSTPLDEFRGSPTRAAELAEIVEKIASSGIKHVYLQYVSLPGRVLGKVVPARHFERFANNGIAFANFAAAGMVTAIDGSWLGEDAMSITEGVLVPELPTFEVLPWDHEYARVFGRHFYASHDGDRAGQPVAADARSNLYRLHAQFQADLGLTLKSGCEPEMSWFPDRSRMTAASISMLPAFLGTSYNIAHIEQMRPVLKKVTQYGQELGLDMIQADYEDPGQLEMNFEYDDCEKTADRLTTFRQICKQVASEVGMVATFMAKPVAGIMGNGCHHNLSLWRGDEPVFRHHDRDGLDDIAKWALGGILTHARGMTAICASTVNSYARYWDAGLYAPTAPMWGYDNRQCIVRVLASRMEFRTPDASANPYLTHAALLAAIRDGIENQIDPGPGFHGKTLPDLKDARFPLLPRTLGDALDALAADDVIRAAMPGDLYTTFSAVKRDEWHRACGAITDWQIDTYLNYLP